MARVESTCHRLQNTSSNLIHGLRAIEILGHLCQDHSYGCDILNTRTYSLLTIANNARLMQIVRPESENHIRRLSQDIQFSAIECIKLITTPRAEDGSPHGALMSLKPGWNIETTWNWLLQTMLALKLLPDEYTPGRPRRQQTTCRDGYTSYPERANGTSLTL